MEAQRGLEDYMTINHVVHLRLAFIGISFTVVPGFPLLLWCPLNWLREDCTKWEWVGSAVYLSCRNIKSAQEA